MSDREIYLRLRRRAALAVLLMAVWVVMVAVAARIAQADELAPDPGCGRLPDAPWCAGPSDDPLEHVTASAVQSCEDGVTDVVYTVALDGHARGPVGVTVRTPLGDTARTVTPGETVTVTDDTRTSRWWGQIVVAGEVLVDADWGPLTCDPAAPVRPPSDGTDDEPGPVEADQPGPAAASNSGGGAGPVEVRWPDPAPDAPDAAVDITSGTDVPAADVPEVGDPGGAGTSPAADATPDAGEVAVTVARATDPDAPGRPSSAWWALVLAGAAVVAVAGIDFRWRALSARVAGTLRTTPPTSPGGAERGPAVSPTRPRLAAGDGRTPHTSDRGGRGEL